MSLSNAKPLPESVSYGFNVGVETMSVGVVKFQGVS